MQTETNRAVYTYHPNGLRKTKAAYNASNVLQSSTTYTWSGDALVMETVGSTNKRYFYGLDLVAGTSGTTATTNYFTHDAHGSVALTTNTSGTAVQPYEYDAFGNLLNAASGDTNPFRYSGEYFDSETGNYYLRARYYDPGIGRFTQQDTHWNVSNLIYGDDVQKLNLTVDVDGIESFTAIPQILAIRQAGNHYGYCVNNPIMYVDPTGDFFISTTTLLILGGIALFGTIGGLAGNHVAEEQGATGWEKAAYISGGILIGGTVGGLGGYYLAPAVIGATGVTGISASAAGITTITATGTSSVALYQTIEQGLNFAVKAKEHMNDPNRYVPMSLLIEAIRHGTATPDPRGSDAIMYTIELIRNSTPYILEVLYHAETNSVWHFMYYRG